MLFVNDDGRYVNVGGSRAIEYVKGTGVFAALRAHALLETFKMNLKIQKIRRATANLPYFLNSDKRERALLSITKIVVILPNLLATYKCYI